MKKVLFLFLACALAAVSQAEIVNVDFTANAANGPTGNNLPGVIGKTSPTWNAINNASLFSNLLDEDGNTTSIDFQLTGTKGDKNTAGQFAVESGGSSSGFFWSYAFLHASGDPGSYDISTFTISGLNAGGTYDIYYYATWSWVDAGSEFRLSEDGGSTWSAWKLSDGVPSEATAAFSEGHSYVVFLDVVADTNGQILGEWQTTLAGASTRHRGMFNALQIKSGPSYIEQNSSGNGRLRSTGSDVDLAPAGTTGDVVLWEQVDASPGYFYIQNVGNSKRLRAVNATTVDLADAGTTGSQVEWRALDYDGTWSFILSRSQGTKLHASSAGGWDVNLVDSQFTGANVQWRGLVSPLLPTATSPNPTDAALDIFPGVTLSWIGQDTISPTYSVNIGTTSACDEVLSNYSVGSSTSYSAVGLLDYDTKYFWRIDIEDQGQTYPGTVWEFTTNDGQLWVDDFYDYTDTADLLTTWQPGGGASLTYEPLTNIMQFSYDNTASPYTSEATLDFSPAEDWLLSGLSSLDMKLLGLSTNSTEPISITLSDGTLAYTVEIPNISAVEEGIWQMVSVQLADFAAGGVSLSNIETLSIQVGSGIAAGGTGTVFINDLILYPPRCLSLYANAADLTGDCEVNVDDLIAIAGTWLDQDFTVSAVVPPSSIASYAFEETSGYTAADGQGSQDAAITPVTATGFWDASGYVGRCLLLADSDLEVTLPSSVFSGVSDDVTISLWINGQAGSVPDPIEAVEIIAGTVPVASEDWDRLQWDIVSPDQYEGWSHYALVKDGAADLMQIYVNGILVSQSTDASAVLSGGSAGQTVLSLVPGQAVTDVKVDEMQIYDTVLTQAEIIYLAQGPGGQAVQPISPVMTNSDIILDGSVNLNDLAQLASAWLSDQNW